MYKQEPKVEAASYCHSKANKLFLFFSFLSFVLKAVEMGVLTSEGGKVTFPLNWTIEKKNYFCMRVNLVFGLLNIYEKENDIISTK